MRFLNILDLAETKAHWEKKKQQKKEMNLTFIKAGKWNETYKWVQAY